MARFTDSINLSDELTCIPISDLIIKAKSLISAKGYSQNTIWNYNGRFNDLQHNAAFYGTENLSEEFIAAYIEEGKQRSAKLASSDIQRKALLNVIAKAANITPIFPYEKDANAIQSMSHRKSINGYEQYLREQGLRQTTIRSYQNTATKFLLYLDKSKKSINKVTAIDVRGFITDLGTQWSPRSMRIVPSILGSYLRFTGAPPDAILFSNFRTPRKSKPIRAMSLENVEALWKYVKGNDGDLRAKAVVAILLATGMRPVDITGLMLDDINWRTDSISFIQSKTGEFMSIKLFPVLGSAITRYMLEERPKGTGINYVFLTKTAPYRRLSPPGCNHILKTALDKSGVPFIADDLHSPRSARRSLVSRMIAEGVPVQKAAAAIGHVDEKSVDLYIELDVEKMRALCLPIPNPMKEWLTT